MRVIYFNPSLPLLHLPSLSHSISSNINLISTHLSTYNFLHPSLHSIVVSFLCLVPTFSVHFAPQSTNMPETVFLSYVVHSSILSLSTVVALSPTRPLTQRNTLLPIQKNGKSLHYVCALFAAAIVECVKSEPAEQRVETDDCHTWLVLLAPWCSAMRPFQVVSVFTSSCSCYSLFICFLCSKFWSPSLFLSSYSSLSLLLCIPSARKPLPPCLSCQALRPIPLLPRAYAPPPTWPLWCLNLLLSDEHDSSKMVHTLIFQLLIIPLYIWDLKQSDE